MKAAKRWLWRAEYKAMFRSSSGMEEYTAPADGVVYVATTGDSISEVAKMIQASLDCQTHIYDIVRAEYLGPAYFEENA